FRTERMTNLPQETDADGQPVRLRGFISGAALLAGDTGLLMHSTLSDDYGPWPLGGSDTDSVAHDGDWLESARRRNASHLFVAAYGNTRRLFRPGQIETRFRPAIDRLRSLFNPDYRIMGLDFDDKLGNGRQARYRALLKKALFADDELMHEIKAVHFDDLELEESDVSDAVQQDQTYTATLKLGADSARTVNVPTAWLADLIGHLMLDQKEVTDPADFEGLVLVDDIDLHIHPDWQTRLVPALKRAFPKVQFIVTTHSPLIISSLRPEEVVVLDLDKEGNIVANPLAVDPRLLTSAELYRHVFGVQNTPPDPIHRTLRRYEYLARDGSRTADEQARMLRLREELEAAGIRDLIDPDPWQQDHGEA
ncbi:MAG: AAA family ATPase, partial [Myxococcales bacterium]|nr:AAA family ATPase [Myxococcales bacterium]